MPRYSAVLEVEFDAAQDSRFSPEFIASQIANGTLTGHIRSGHVTPHTVRLAEEPSLCPACDLGKDEDCICPIEDAWCGSFKMTEED